MTGDPRGHCWRSRQRRVQPAKVVVRDIQACAGDEVLQLLRESKSQASEAPEERSDGQVVPLDMACTDRILTDAPHDDAPDRANQIRGSVAAGLLTGGAVVLDDLAVVGTRRESVINGVRICLPAVGRNLRPRASVV